MPSVAARVHHPVSTPFGFHVRGPVVQPSGVQPSGVRSASSGVRCPPVRCPVIWCPPSARSHPSRPQARRWPRGSRRCGGQPSRPGRIELHVVHGDPSGLVDGPSRPGGRCCVGARPRSVVVVEPDRPGGQAGKGPTSSTGRMGAAPARPSQEVSEPGSGAEDAVTCENSGGRDRV
jgi:hypothetical protein